jgi:uncharacterized protein (DUF952 family)
MGIPLTLADGADGVVEPQPHAGRVPRYGPPMAPIYHLAEPAHWADAVLTGSYAWSTRGRTLAQEGFLHASTDDQWQQVRRRFYADLKTGLVLLTIDPDRLSVPLRFEVGDPATGERFPHIYGPLDLRAVVATRVLPAPHA